MIVIVDYGMGNLKSVRNAVETLGGKVAVSSSPSVLKRAKKVILPGVGAFGDAMRGLRRLKLVKPLKDVIKTGKPFLGLCLGLQILFEQSEEGDYVKGLGILRGKVRKFRLKARSLKIPHMGWNRIKVKNQRSKFKNEGRNTKILKGIPDESFMYFVHSYYVEPKDGDIVLTTTDYGREFVSGIWKDNICAFQFHPEKSQKVGLKILRNFIKLC